jgi:hypothetical protein
MRMSKDEHSLSERVEQAFSQHGRSWRDHVLLADREPASNFVVSTDGVALLHIDDPALAAACREYLSQHGVRTFTTFDEFDRAFQVRREINVRKVDDVAYPCAETNGGRLSRLQSTHLVAAVAELGSLGALREHAR